ncbi:glycosyltransferase family 4 protein [Aestuariicoccus sp. KMU-90]|uniref:Glycosyltransferase family 4 protein n=1 Tax=Thetidibacter halocola TaxID=2827239 RepID=A0A8J7W9J3_9RHOB|nr:exopolysaccharide biosynthesis GT4 family glycosyltransferase EpsE [Thetidibacter halocola]MBS0123395.1 glycosyltransferase family 4 protein [Thetidibacter halocola]
MRIGYVVPQFPGQTHIFFWREIRALESLGHEVRVISTRRPPRGLIAHDWSDIAMERTHYLDALAPGKILGGTARLLPRGLLLWMLRDGLWRDAPVSLGAAQDLYSLSVDERLDHIHVHSCGRAALIAAFARQMGGPPYSLTLHGPLSDYGPGQRFKWRHAAFATVITRKLEGEVQQALAGSLPDRVIVRPMGVDTDSLRRDTPYAPPEKGRPLRIFSCGRLNIVKGHQDLMSAVRQLLDQGVDVRLEIAGEDDAGGTGYRAELEAHLKRLHLQDHVRLLGAIDAGAVKDKLAEAHLFVLASWHEPLGVAYMEAMAMGVPVIGTEAGGVPELIEDGRTGILVPPQNPATLARTIRDLAGDPARLRRYAEAGRAHVEAHFRSALGAETLAEAIAATRD